MGQAIHRVLSALERFDTVLHGMVLAIDNNLAERTLRPCAIGRKNWLFWQLSTGALWQCYSALQPVAKRIWWNLGPDSGELLARS